MATAREISALQRGAQELRITVLRMLHAAGSGHVGGSFSCAEILAVLYESVMQVRPHEPQWQQRDRFILSKGHAAPMLYAMLAKKGYFEPALLMTLRTTGSPLQGHPSMRCLPGVDMSAGSLGMGLSAGLGMALAARLNRESWRVFVLCGDGELNEGQNWEAFMALGKWRPENFVAIIDRNHVQLDGCERDIMPLGDIAAKIAAFGIHTESCNGHDVRALLAACAKASAVKGPVVIVAETIKGKGVSFMEGNHVWHGKPIDDAAFVAAMSELEQGVP